MDVVKKIQLQYLQVFSRTNGVPLSYKIQGIWDYANTGKTGRWGNLQTINVYNPHYNVIYRRHKIRGNGYALQFKITSSSGEPFDIIGWAGVETINQGT